ncbi:conserved protein, unknown function [Hepatocystis sp. ex Piliocolobus tephrosceles]|nr:conserved protein, unknown function [Hepatocystis sp. ex Piliocolobus tephrosceles]
MNNIEKKQGNNSIEKHNETDKDLENLVIKHSTYNLCFLLLSGLQLYFLGEKKSNKHTTNCGNSNNTKKCGNSNQTKQCLKKSKKKCTKHLKLKDHILNDYNIFYEEPQKVNINEETSSFIPIYNKK